MSHVTRRKAVSTLATYDDEYRGIDFRKYPDKYV